MFSKLLKATLWVFDKLLLLFLVFFVLILSLGSYILYPLLFSHESASLDSSGTQPTRTGSQIYRLSWQEPFDYEVKIYTNHYRYIAQNETDFFESAQLLWHIPSLSLADKYPQLKHKTTMKIPRKVIRNKRFKNSLYAHIFVQRVGKFTPHPDITDPELVNLSFCIAWWQNPQETRGWKGNLSDDTPLELMTATMFPLSIVLENQEYRKEKMPQHLYDSTFNIPWHKLKDNAYIPSVSINQYTRNPIDFMPKVVMRSNERAGGPHELDVDLELELEGIRRAWIVIKEAALTYSFPGREYEYNKLSLIDLVVAEGYNPDIPDDHSIDHRPLALVEKVSAVNLLVAAILFIIQCLLGFTLIRALVNFYFNPSEDWSGISIMLPLATVASNVLQLLHNCLVYGSFSSISSKNIFQLSCCFFSLYSHMGSTKPTSQTDSPPAETPNAGQPAEKSREAQIPNTARPVDKKMFKWCRRLLLPFLAVICAHASVSSSANGTLRGFAKVVIRDTVYFMSFFIMVPQIIVNYQTKSGSHFPVSLAIAMLLDHVVKALLKYFTGDVARIVDGIPAEKWALVASLAVMIAQWAWYKRK